MTKYKTSVIIPVYNTEQYLDACIQSVLNQSQKEVEIILVDDGSTDRSYDIMLSYAGRYKNVSVFRQENKKLGAARNLGMMQASGKYIFFLDSDDCMKEKCLEELYNCAEVNRLDFVTYDSEILVERMTAKRNFPTYDRSRLGIETDAIYCGWDYLNTYFRIGGVFVSACLAYYNADFLRKYLISFEEQVYYEDNEFSLKIYYHAERMMYLARKLYVRRYRENSIMTSDCGIIHLQSVLKMNEKCVQMLIQIPDSIKNMEGIRGIIAILANRLINQMQLYKNDLDLQNNQYICDLCNFLGRCDKKLLLSHLGLELAYDYYYILAMIIEKGYLTESPNVQEELYIITAMLKFGIKEVIDELFTRLKVLIKNEEKIVIYGTGETTERIISCCRIIYGDTLNLENKVVFANTEVQQRKMYLDKYPLLPIDNVGCFSVTAIIVASTRYESEMCALLEKLFGKKYAYLTYREIANISLDGDVGELFAEGEWRI